MYKNTDSAWLIKPISAWAFKPWLIDKGSLTMRLQKSYPIFRVKSVQVSDAKPIIDEAILLGLPKYKSVLIREVLLLGNNQPVVFAHSILPKASLRGEWQKLGKLGNRPLGAALFANPKVKRAPLRFKNYPRIIFCISTRLNILAEKPACLWARRSVFSLNCATILITEIFLPQLLST